MTAKLTTRQTKKQPRPIVATDAFLMDLLRHSREHGIREERERVCAWLRRWAPAFADAIERGEHDA